MGKLNYTNRKIVGIKLGQTVKKDLLKRISDEKTTSRTASKDSCLDLLLSGKALGDEGLDLVFDGLIQAISTGATHLEELNVSSNSATAAILKKLAQVIQISSSNLKVLDLSNNNLSLTSEADALAWEEFLTSFEQVNCLRRLNLSNNPLGSGPAFEIFLRCYARQYPIGHLRRLSSAIEESSDEEEDEEEDDYAHEADSDPGYFDFSLTSNSSTRSPAGSDSSATKNLKIHGLRSIPYIILSETGMTDASALHLSYVVQAQPLPKQLLALLGSMNTELAEISDRPNPTFGCSGLIYLPNAGLSTQAIKLLELAETYRETQSWLASHTGHPIRNPTNVDFPNTTRRRSSELASPTTPYSLVGSTIEIDRVRSKLQGAIIKHDVLDVELWLAVLRTLIYGRIFLLDVVQDSVEQWRSQIVPFYSPEGEYSSLNELHKQESATALQLPPMEVSNLPKKLPEHVWSRIISLVADPKNVLSPVQREAVLQYAAKREALLRERELAGKLRTVQIWRLLESLNCLTYQM